MPGRGKKASVSQTKPIRVATVTLSDTRTEADDGGGRLLGELLRAAGFEVLSHAILREDPSLIRTSVLGLCEDPRVEAVVLTGGTGLAPRDHTVESIEPLFDKPIEGFGEAFRRLSWDQIGPRAILSRAAAGLVRGRVVVALPGNPKAVRLGVEGLLAPTLAHAVELAQGRHVHHHEGNGGEKKGSR
jgi:molybdenum cofactor biosynthesis protein B